MLEIGSSLREARRRRNLELAEVERATRIRVQQLDALEHERFDLLPPDPYRRSFLREYADFLGLDGDLYAQEYELRFATPEPRPPAPPPRQRLAAPLLGNRPLLRMGGFALVALIGVAAWQLGGSSTGTPPQTVQTPTQTRPHHHRHAPAKAPRRAAPTLALIAAHGSCWLRVRLGSNTGTTVYEQTLHQGQAARFGLGQPLWIRLGAPWNLQATLGPRSLTLPARTGDVLVTSAGLQPAP
jgi:cytoskeleton protein RodZ